MLLCVGEAGPGPGEGVSPSLLSPESIGVDRGDPRSSVAKLVVPASVEADVGIGDGIGSVTEIESVT